MRLMRFPERHSTANRASRRIAPPRARDRPTRPLHRPHPPMVSPATGNHLVRIRILMRRSLRAVAGPQVTAIPRDGLPQINRAGSRQESAKTESGNLIRHKTASASRVNSQRPSVSRVSSPARIGRWAHVRRDSAVRDNGSRVTRRQRIHNPALPR